MTPDLIPELVRNLTAGQVLELFRRGFDTCQIARRFLMDEGHVASLLRQARNDERRLKGRAS